MNVFIVGSPLETAMLLVDKTNVWLRSWYMHNGYEYHSSEDEECDWLVKKL